MFGEQLWVLRTILGYHHIVAKFESIEVMFYIRGITI